MFQFLREFWKIFLVLIVLTASISNTSSLSVSSTNEKDTKEDVLIKSPFKSTPNAFHYDEQTSKPSGVQEMPSHPQAKGIRMTSASEANPTYLLVAGGGSCLKKGTNILMATKDEDNKYVQKPVEDIKVGDEVLDVNLKAAKVIRVSTEFLVDRAFFGLDETPPFFTESHILVGPSLSHASSTLRFYVKDKDQILRQNPLMRFTDITNVSENNDFEIYYFNQESQTVETKLVSFQGADGNIQYPQETQVYFLYVSSPTGTYFANSFLSIGQIPPVHKWPNTMSLLFQLSSSPELVSLISSLPPVPQSIDDINDIVFQVGFDVFAALKHPNFTGISLVDETINIKCNNSCTEIFNRPMFSTFAIGIYSNLGEFFACLMDRMQPCDPKWKAVPESKTLIFQQLAKDILLKKSLHYFSQFNNRN